MRFPSFLLMRGADFLVSDCVLVEKISERTGINQGCVKDCRAPFGHNLQSALSSCVQLKGGRHANTSYSLRARRFGPWPRSSARRGSTSPNPNPTTGSQNAGHLARNFDALREFHLLRCTCGQALRRCAQGRDDARRPDCAGLRGAGCDAQEGDRWRAQLRVVLDRQEQDCRFVHWRTWRTRHGLHRLYGLAPSRRRPGALPGVLPEGVEA